MRSKTDAEGRTTVYEYDLLSRLKLEMDPLGQVTSLLYDGMGNVTSVTNPDQTTTGYEYDLASRLVGINYQDGASVSYTYDKLGRRTSMVDSTGTTSYTYDLLSRLTSVTDGRGQTIRYSWTENGQRESMTYPDGSVVNYEVDLLDRIVGVIDSAGRRTSYEYDARGMLTTKTLPTGAMSTYVYNELGQLLELTHRNQQGKSVEQLIYAYDPLGNRTRMERIEGEDDEDDAEGGRVVSEYTYDALNQLITVSKYNAGDSGSTITTNYSYDKVGNRLTKATSWGDLSDVEQYTYNALDQLTRWQNGLNYKDYTYDPRGNLLKVLGVTDAADPVMAIEDLLPDPEAANPENAAVTDSVYTETGLSAVQDEELSAMSEPSVPQLLESYAWNSANRLIQHINEAGDITRYTYDGDDNRISMIVDLAHGPKGNGNNGNNGKGNNGNGNGNGNGNNNGNGNGNNGNGNGNGNKCDHVVPPGFVPPGLAKKCGQDWGDETETYPIEHPSGPRDGWEHQYKKKHQEYYFTNDVSMALPEAIQITGDNASEWKETFVYGAGGERVSYTYLPAYDANNGWEPTTGVSGTNAGAPKTLWYLTDALGSTLGLIEQDGRVSSRYHYDEFGVVLDDKKFDPNWPGPDNLYGYTGLGYDYTSGLTYARARYYQPEIGRFVSEDTYKGEIVDPLSLNLYKYVKNNPLRYTDPSGHFEFEHSPFESPTVIQLESQDYWEGVKKRATNVKKKITRLNFFKMIAEEVVEQGVRSSTSPYVWGTLTSTQRGEFIEEYLAEDVYDDWFHIGKERGGYFETIDFQKDGQVVSVKSIDPRSYKSSDIVTRKLLDHLDELQSTQIYIDREFVKYKNRILDIVVPEGYSDEINIEALLEEADGIIIRIREY
ncbi:RHS repeat-associated core domain-containing protein [Paenibacillus nanensis]|uniref:RHS repeat-associated core domain-containing protein n=1 Tax=Paenibacillus nanensis TaxID=393251 RepID=UPI0011C3D5D7